MKLIFDYNRTIFDPESNRLFPGVIEMLERLAEKHDLCLISMNEPGRDAVLESLGIKRLFERISFVDQKTEELFVNLAEHSTDVFVIGDRVKDEIKIGNRLGFKTIWVRQGKFGAERPTSAEEEPTYAVSSIVDIEKILTRYEK